MEKYMIPKSYSRVLWFSTLSTVIIYVFSYTFYDCLLPYKRFIDVLGIIFSAVGVYGRLGWKIQTWSGSTPKEQKDEIWCKIFCGLGFFGMMLNAFL